MHLDIIIPVYNEGGAISGNLKAIHSVVQRAVCSHRLIIVDDGSTDSTWAEIQHLAEESNINILAVGLSRNFGKEAAICAGIMETSADFCLVMDSDLQHPPDMIPEMIEHIKSGYDIVECVKTYRGEEGFLKKLAAVFFYKLINRFSGFNMSNASDFKLINKNVIEAWKSMGETNTFFRGMVEWLGFNKAQLQFSVQSRNGGSSKFSPLMLAKLAVNAITAFSSAPLYITNMLSMTFFVLALILGIQTLYNKFSGIAVDGFTTVILLLLILGSAILFCLGVIGAYISKIYDEVKSRPRYIISKRIINQKS